MTKLPELRRPALLALVLSTLACSSLAAPQDSPRALLERGAFAEEHERNFDDAETLYARAAEAAHAANDAATEKEANAAKNRVLTRQGKAPAANAQAASELPQQALRLLHDGALLDPKTDAGKAAIADLAIAGSSIVPALETMFSAQTDFTIDGERLSPNPMFAIYALAAINTPEATAALARCQESPDPLLRHAIVMATGAWTHRALLERAARDPVTAVADAALSRLDDTCDPALADLMELGVRRGNHSVCGWLAQNVPERALTLAEDRGLSSSARTSAGQHLALAKLPASLANASRLLALAHDSDAGVAHWAQFHVSRLANEWKSSLPALREPVGKLIVAEIERSPTPALVEALGEFSPSNTPQVLSALVRKVGDAPDAELVRSVRNAIESTQVDDSAGAFDAWLAFARSVPPSWKSESGISIQGFASKRLELLSRTTPLDALVRGAHDLPPEIKEYYSRGLTTRVRDESHKSEASGSLDPAVLAVASAWYGIDRKEASETIAYLLGKFGDVEQLPFALDMIRDGYGNQASPAAQQIISRSPQRAADVLAQQFVKLAELPAPTGLETAIVRLLGALPDDMGLAMFRTWYPKMKSAAAKQALLSTLTTQTGGPAATAELLARYPEIAAYEWYTRKAAVERFGRELCEPAIPLLGEALKDPNDEVRTAARSVSEAFKQQRQALEEFAAWTSSSKEARDSVAELTKLLESANRDVVLGAIKSLAAVKAKTALPALVKLLEKNDPELKKAVQDAIARIGE